MATVMPVASPRRPIPALRQRATSPNSSPMRYMAIAPFRAPTPEMPSPKTRDASQVETRRATASTPRLTVRAALFSISTRLRDRGMVASSSSVPSSSSPAINRVPRATAKLMKMAGSIRLNGSAFM